MQPSTFRIKVVFLGCRDLFYLEGEVQKRGCFEVFLGILLHDGDSHVRVMYALDQMSDALDVLSFLLHFLDELNWS